MIFFTDLEKEVVGVDLTMSGVRKVIPGSTAEVLKSRAPFTLGAVATELLGEKPFAADEFDLKKILECLCKLLASADEGSSTWHRVFEEDNQDYRDAIKWGRLKEFYWGNGLAEQDKVTVDRLMFAFESILDEGYQTILSALFVKVVGKCYAIHFLPRICIVYIAVF